MPSTLRAIKADRLALQQPCAGMEEPMTLAAIMVHVDFDAQAEDRISVAADLAGRFDSLLIGVGGWALRKWADPEHSNVEFPPAEEARQAKIAEQLQLLGERFRRTAGPNRRGVEWRSSSHIPNEVLVREARAADLVVVGQAKLPDDVYHTFDPGAVIVASGRPVLLVPSGLRRVEASRVMIAWKDSREARRALLDALPFLQKAASVLVAAVASPDLEVPAREQIADVTRYLEHHRVAVAQQIVETTDEGEGNVILGLAAEHGADLIVAGAYGRSRLSELVFGGVTRHLLTKSKVPCLFSN
jgi:nucleotide-binding universal stress UspA family protein